MSSEYREKLASIGYLARGRTRDKKVDGRRPNGERMLSTTDELGNTVHESAEQRDVVIKAPLVKASLSQKEIRQ